MAYRQIVFRSAARQKVLRGAEALADAVRGTLGPKSRCVLIEKKWGAPGRCTHGVTVAKEIELEDPEENLGAKMIKQAAEKTGDSVGGTSTATVLAYALIAEGMRNGVAGSSAIDIKRGLDRGLKVVVDAIRQASRPVTSRREKAQIAAIAAHDDSAIGNLVAEAVERVGKDGVVTVEEATGTETSFDVVEGMQFDRGDLSPYFVTDPARMDCMLEEPLILLCEGRISVMKDLLSLLKQVVQMGKPLVIVAEDVEGDALATRVVNQLRGSLHGVAVRARRRSLAACPRCAGACASLSPFGRSLAAVPHQRRCEARVRQASVAMLPAHLNDPRRM